MAAVALALARAAGVAWGSSDFLAGIKSRNVAVLSVLVVSQDAGLVLVLNRCASLALLACTTASRGRRSSASAARSRASRW